MIINDDPLENNKILDDLCDVMMMMAMIVAMMTMMIRAPTIISVVRADTEAPSLAISTSAKTFLFFYY